MEYQVLDEKTTKDSTLRLENEGINYLKQGRKWALFLAILALVGLVLVFLGTLAMIIFGKYFGQSGPQVLISAIVILVFILVYCIPIVYLLKFTQETALASRQNDNAAFNRAIKYLHLHFKSAGIICISIILLYILIIIAVVFMYMMGITF